MVTTTTSNNTKDTEATTKAIPHKASPMASNRTISRVKDSTARDTVLTRSNRSVVLCASFGATLCVGSNLTAKPPRRANTLHRHMILTDSLLIKATVLPSRVITTKDTIQTGVLPRTRRLRTNNKDIMIPTNRMVYLNSKDTTVLKMVMVRHSNMVSLVRQENPLKGSAV